MNWIKIILAVLGLLAAVVGIFWLIGIVSALLWYVFWIAIIAGAGYAGYKLFLEKEKETAKLEEKMPIGISEMQNVDRELEEYKRKYLPK
jgi:hypothetical protein